MKKGKKAKFRLILLTTVFFAVLLGLVLSTSKDIQKIYENKNKSLVLKQQFENLIEDEKRLESELTKLKDPEYVARYAKEKYMFSGENETIIRID